MNAKFYYVYLITNTEINKQYVGSRTCYKNNISDDMYWGSSKYLKEDYKKYGLENFTKKILKTYTSVEEMLKGESDYIIKYNTLSPNGYNRFLSIKTPKFYMHGVKHSEETKEKIKKSMKGKNVGKIQTEETKKKRALANTGKIRTEETKEKTRQSLLGVKHTEERKNNISRAHLGQVPWNKGKRKKIS